jgi:hypothetical protein
MVPLQDVIERLECGEVEVLGFFIVAYRDRYMLDHMAQYIGVLFRCNESGSSPTET